MFVFWRSKILMTDIGINYSSKYNKVNRSSINNYILCAKLLSSKYDYH